MTSILLTPRWTTPVALVALAMPVALAGQDTVHRRERRCYPDEPFDARRQARDGMAGVC